jgi:ubiquinone/menaquinone biosynthesis C-methylase UbiE
LKLILMINRIPLLNRILSVKLIKNSGNKDITSSDYWEKSEYAEATNYLNVCLRGNRVLSIPYRRSMLDIYLHRKHTVLHKDIKDLVDIGYVPPITENSKIFEPGCNVGTILFQLHQMYKCEVYGMDISPDAISYAERKLFSQISQSKFYVGDVLEYSFFKQFKDNFFSITIAASHLGHVKNCNEKSKYIKKLQRISQSVIIFNKIHSKNEDIDSNFEDYERKYGFKCFRIHRKPTPTIDKFSGTYYFTKTQT